MTKWSFIKQLQLNHQLANDVMAKQNIQNMQNMNANGILEWLMNCINCINCMDCLRRLANVRVFALFIRPLAR